MKKLVIIDSHPVQYRAPLFKRLGGRIDLKVYFKKRGASEVCFDSEFGKEIIWDTPTLDGYKYEFVPSLLKMLFKIRKFKPDAIMIYGWNSWGNWIVALFSNIWGIKLLLQAESPLNQESSRSGIKSLFRKILLKIFFTIVDSFLYIGKENQKFYKYYGIADKNLFFTPYSVDNERLQNAITKDLRKKLGLADYDIVILFVGKLISKKRPMDLLRAYELLELDKKALVFVGDGELKKELENYVRKKELKKVIFAGFKNQTELPDWYESADVFVLPSGPGETWGLVVNEAMNFGLPVIVSDMVGCGSDLVKDGENGFIFKLGDVDMLAGSLRKLEDRDMSNELGKRSLEKIKHYNYEVIIESIIESMN